VAKKKGQLEQGMEHERKSLQLDKKQGQTQNGRPLIGWVKENFARGCTKENATRPREKRQADLKKAGQKKKKNREPMSARDTAHEKKKAKVIIRWQGSKKRSSKIETCGCQRQRKGETLQERRQ
jgi:hypothetical protein